MSEIKPVLIACDHGGYALKQSILKHLSETGVKVRDFGCESEASCDYPEYAEKLCRAIQNGEGDRGILLCGTGIGMSIAANKCRGIRAACCHDTFSARMTRLHNDANVLCMGGRVIGTGLANDLVDLFLSTPFLGERHAKRIEMIEKLEEKR